MENYDEKFEELGLMIKNGFDAVDHRFDKVEKDMTELKQGQIDIKLRMDNFVNDGSKIWN